jgi:hypothetical protein
MRITENMFEQFVYFIMPFMIIFLGLIGNLLGLVTLGKRKQADSEIGPIHMYRFLFIIDSIILFSFQILIIDEAYSIGIFLLSIFSCKLFIYLSFALCSLSSFNLIYILIESYLSIKYPVESNLLRKNKPQFIYTTVIYIINLIYFLPIFLISGIIQVHPRITNNNETFNLTCTFKTTEEHGVQALIFINRILLPLFLIIFFSTILIHKIYTSTSRMNTFYSDRERIKFKKDVRLSIISISFNFIQNAFSIPLFIEFFIFNNRHSLVYFLSINIFYLSYAFTFYFLLLVNSLFRKEFFSIFIKSQADVLEIEMETILRRT